MNDPLAAADRSYDLIDAPIVLTAGRDHAAAIAFLVSAGGSLAPAAGAWLSAEEMALLPGPRYPRRRHELVAGRLAAKHALAHLRPGIDVQRLSILPGVLGQPVVSGPGIANVGVTLSHSGEAAVAIAFPERCPVGVDIETFAEDCGPVLARHAGGAERNLVREAAIGSELQGLTALWCAKEAMAKLLRCGLAAHGATLGVSGATRDGARLRLDFAGFAGYRAFVAFGRRRCFAVALPPTVAWRPEASDWLASPAAWLDSGTDAANGTAPLKSLSHG